LKHIIIALIIIVTTQATAATIRGYREGEAVTLDPMQLNDAESGAISFSIFSSLLTFHYLKRPKVLVPDLLEKMPEKLSSGLYRFTLRKDARFHDDACFPGGKGRSVESQDVAYSLKRFADANVNMFNYQFFEGLIKGLDEFRAASQQPGFSFEKAEIIGVRIIDRYTFTLNFSKESPLNFYRLAYASIVPREAVEKYGRDFGRHPVGSGPFMLKEFPRRGTVVLERNPYYYRTYPSDGNPGDREKGFLDAAGRKLPLADRIELPLIEEAQPRLLNFMAGKLDYLRVDSDTFNANLQGSPGSYSFKDKKLAEMASIQSEVSDTLSMLRFSMKDPLVGVNRKLRKAIATAIDLQAYLGVMQPGVGIPADSVVPPLFAGSSKETGSAWHKFSKDEARKLLSEAGYPGGKGLPELSIDFGTATQKSRRTFEFLRHSLDQIGIKLKANFHQTYGSLVKQLESGNFQMSFVAWTPAYSDAEGLYMLFYSKNMPPMPNYSFYRNPEYDRLYEASRDMPNGPERYRLFSEMDRILKEDVPLAMPYFRADVYLASKRLPNLRGYPTFDHLFLK
jgi:ABC-type transport system substrate-binding protein